MVITVAVLLHQNLMRNAKIEPYCIALYPIEIICTQYMHHDEVPQFFLSWWRQGLPGHTSKMELSSIHLQSTLFFASVYNPIAQNLQVYFVVIYERFIQSTTLTNQIVI